MTGVSIKSREALREWLDDKPAEWARVVALRVALRVLPLASDPARYHNEQPDPQLTMAVFRVMVILSGAGEIPFVDAVGAAVRAAAEARGYALAVAENEADAAAEAAVSGALAADAAASAHVVAVAARAVAITGHAKAEHSYWQAIWEDCGALKEGVSPEQLMARPLWGIQPNWFTQSWRRAEEWLERNHALFDRNWYRARLHGASYALPWFDADTDRLFHQFLIDKEDDWWKREPAEVNREIADWVNSQEHAPSLSAEAQDATATVFKASDTGLAEIDRTAGNVQLSKDDASHKRHATALQKVQRAGDALRGNNNAYAFAPVCDDIVHALGRSLNETEPATLVLEAQSLRDALDIQQAYTDRDEFAPLSGEQLRLAKGAINALNLFIGLDPYLEEIDTKVAGPDATNIASPEDVRALADVTRGEVTTPEADEVLRKSADHAPEVSDPANRKTGLMVRIGLNLVRWSINVIVEHEKELQGVLVGGAAVGLFLAPWATGGTVVGGAAIAFRLCQNIKKNEGSWRRIAQQARVTSANFDLLMEKLNNLPLE